MDAVDFDEIKSISKKLVDKMLDKYPDAGYTIWINVWMDDTFQVICRSAVRIDDDNIICRDFKWYDGEISYEEREEYARVMSS